VKRPSHKTKKTMPTATATRSFPMAGLSARKKPGASPKYGARDFAA
jgi:hypothetical protein